MVRSERSSFSSSLFLQTSRRLRLRRTRCLLVLVTRPSWSATSTAHPGPRWSGTGGLSSWRMTTGCTGRPWGPGTPSPYTTSRRRSSLSTDVKQLTHSGRGRPPSASQVSHCVLCCDVEIIAGKNIILLIENYSVRSDFTTMRRLRYSYSYNYYIFIF